MNGWLLAGFFLIGLYGIILVGIILAVAVPAVRAPRVTKLRKLWLSLILLTCAGAVAFMVHALCNLAGPTGALMALILDVGIVIATYRISNWAYGEAVNKPEV